MATSDKFKIGDHVRYYSTKFNAILKGTVVEIKGDRVKSKMDTPIEYFIANKYDSNWIERWPNGSN